MPKSSFRTALVVPAFLVGISSPSQDRAPRAVTNSPPSSETISLRPMIVTATRHHEQDLDLPFVITQIDARRLRSELMAASLPEALQESPGVLVQQTAHGQGSPFLRGFTGFRTLALVDGVRLNNSTFRDGPNQYWSTIDILAVDQIEVVRGPGSVMYGSDAIGGVVNALMRSPAAGDGPGIRWNGLASYRFGSAERAHLGRVEGGAARAEQWGFTVGVSGKTFGDLDGGREVGRQPQWACVEKTDSKLSEVC